MRLTKVEQRHHYHMTTNIRELLHTDPTCPFCGEKPEDPSLTGINCIVCQPCYETINYWTPSYAKLFTDDGTIELWDYIPVAQSWRSKGCANALFLDPQPAVEELSKQTRKVIIAVTEGNHKDVFERIPFEDVDAEILPRRVPKPIIVAGKWGVRKRPRFHPTEFEY